MGLRKIKDVPFDKVIRRVVLLRIFIVADVVVVVRIAFFF
jgi:hypothetical protein